MKLDSTIKALPWVFNPEEAKLINHALGNELIQAYFQRLKHDVLSLKCLPPHTATEDDIRYNNAYLAGQSQILDSLLASNVLIPRDTTKE